MNINICRNYFKNDKGFERFVTYEIFYLFHKPFFVRFNSIRFVLFIEAKVKSLTKISHIIYKEKVYSDCLAAL